MTAVDRSNTNWTPWPRLAGIPHRLQVIGGVLGIMTAAGLLFQYRLRVGGKRMHIDKHSINHLKVAL